MKISVELTVGEIEDFNRTLKDPNAVRNIREWRKEWKDWWKKASEDELKDVMTECICSTQQRTEAPGYLQFQDEALEGLWKKPRREIEGILRKYGVRFPRNKAGYIDSMKPIMLSHTIQNITARYSGSTLEEERKARNSLLDLGVKGLGPKQASNFLQQIGFSRHIVPLDSRWAKRIGRIMSLRENDDFRYILLEDVVVGIAKRLGVDPAELDAAVWTVEGE